jgi:predicted RNase H-like HicB family nuclease
MKLPVAIYPGEDGWFVAECPVIPGCVSQGRTREEALANIEDAIHGCLEVRRKLGMPLIVELTEVEVAV